MRIALFAALVALTAPTLAQEMVSSADFAANIQSFNGKRVAVGPCNLSPYEISGQFSCRLMDGDNSAKDPNGLPVDIFFDIAALTPEQKAYMTTVCPNSWCDVIGTLTGTATVSQGTDFVVFSEIEYAPAP